MSAGLARWARQTPSKPALVCGSHRRSYAELDSRQRRIAGLLASLGLGVGDRLAVLAANRIELLEVTIGALRCGVVPVPVSPLLTPPEIRYLIEDSGAGALISDRADKGAAGEIPVLRLDGDFERRLAAADPEALAGVALSRPMHYTSGTTGRPKGVWVGPVGESEALRRSAGFCSTWDLRRDDVHLVCSPLTHSAPHRYSMRTLEAGGTVVIQPRFDAKETLVAIGRHGVTTTFVVPTHLERILALDPAQRAHYDVSSMRILWHAGAPIRQVTKRRAIELFPAESVWEFYGSTEGGFTRISPSEWLERPGSVGRAIGRAELQVTSESGDIAPPGEVGQVWVKDPDAERFEYWGAPEKTASAWRRDAYSAGDLGFLDGAGYLFLAGRKHDVIISGGVNVYPHEIEETLAEHPSVAEALVFGVEHEEWGEQVHAAVVPAPGRSIDAEVLRTWARERLAGYKCPRAIEVVDALPRTSTGKIKRTLD